MTRLLRSSLVIASISCHSFIYLTPDDEIENVEIQPVKKEKKRGMTNFKKLIKSSVNAVGRDGGECV